MPYTDPRTGKTTQPPKNWREKAAKNAEFARRKKLRQQLKNRRHGFLRRDCFRWVRDHHPAAFKRLKSKSYKKADKKSDGLRQQRFMQFSAS